MGVGSANSESALRAHRKRVAIAVALVFGAIRWAAVCWTLAAHSSMPALLGGAAILDVACRHGDPGHRGLLRAVSLPSGHRLLGPWPRTAFLWYLERVNMDLQKHIHVKQETIKRIVIYIEIKMGAQPRGNPCFMSPLSLVLQMVNEQYF